jgi:hypothetical protein
MIIHYFVLAFCDLSGFQDYGFLEFELQTSRSLESLVPASSHLLRFEQEMIEGKLSQDRVFAAVKAPYQLQVSYNPSYGMITLCTTMYNWYKGHNCEWFQIWCSNPSLAPPWRDERVGQLPTRSTDLDVYAACHLTIS